MIFEVIEKNTAKTRHELCTKIDEKSIRLFIFLKNTDVIFELSQNNWNFVSKTYQEKTLLLQKKEPSIIKRIFLTFSDDLFSNAK